MVPVLSALLAVTVAVVVPVPDDEPMVSPVVDDSRDIPVVNSCNAGLRPITRY